MTRKTVYWICQIGGWSLYAIINISFNIMFGVQDVQQYSFLLLSVVYMLLVTHAFRHYLHNRQWLKLTTGKLIPRVILAIIIMSMLVYLLQAVTLMLLGQQSLSYFDFSEVLLMFLSQVTIFFIWSVLYIMYHYVERYNSSLKYEAAINEMTLNRLKSQLNPHFMFNALNSIRALVDEEPSKAKVAITQLSNILRNSLVMDKRKVVSFADELKTVKDYLALEGIRFEERLQTYFNIHPEAGDFYIPPLMLQTLVENSIKHGISNLIEGGEVSVEAFVKDRNLHICIRNNGQYINGVKHKNDSGLGLENTRERLKLLYGERASFKISNENEHTVLTELVIPEH
ncbi:sensor histidine kinase [Nafulsella turpanensis]|uniref:sensor histidine kinase n=1 Tax=Nafulsella turpanensis TaxID=1265690 RepID=UPI00047607B6|nr:histidine kinase [Nafulsella turpanensis]